MANLQQIEKGIVILNQKVQASSDEAEKAQYIEQIKVLSNERSKLQNTPAQEAPEATESTAKVDAKGLASSAATGANRGLTGLVDLPFNLVNMALAAGGTPEWLRTATPSQVIDLISEKTTGVRPIEAATTPTEAVDTPSERMLGTLSEYVSGGLGGASALREVAERGASRLAPKPRSQQTVTDSVADAIRTPGFMRSEGLAAVGGGATAAPVREYTDNVYAETFASILGGVTPSVLTSVAPKAKDIIGNFTREGNSLIVSRELAENATDFEQAIDNLSKNRIVVEETLINSGVDPARLTEDPGIMALVGTAAKNDVEIMNIMARESDKVSEEIFEGLEALAGGGGSQKTVAAFEAKTNDLINRISYDIDIARNQMAKIEESVASGKAPEDISTAFVDALESSYKRAKEYETRLWSEVDKSVPFDAKRFRVEAKRLRRDLLRRGIVSSSEATSLFSEVTRFGAKGPIGINTYEGLMNFRSRLLEQKRTALADGRNKQAKAINDFDNVIMNFIENGPQAGNYSAAAELTRTIHQNYNRGKLGKYLNIDAQGDTRIDPEVALNRVVKTGQDVGEIRRAIEAEQQTVLDSGAEIPPAVGLTPNIQDMLYLKFSQATTSEARKKFFSDKGYGPTLRKFPTLARDLMAIDRELDSLAAVVAKSEGRIATLKDKNLTSSAALLGVAPDQLIDTLRKLPQKDLENIYRVAVQEGVEQGLQTSVLERVVTEMLQQGEGGSIGNLSSILNNPSKGLRPSFDVILTPDQKKALVNLDRTNKLLKQNLGRSQSNDWITEANPVLQTTARILGVRVGSLVAPAGPGAIQSASVFANVFQKVIDNLPSAQRKRILVDALQSPDKFQELLTLFKAKNAGPAEIKALDLFLRRSGIRAVEQINRAYEEETRGD